MQVSSRDKTAFDGRIYIKLGAGKAKKSELKTLTPISVCIRGDNAFVKLANNLLTQDAFKVTPAIYKGSKALSFELKNSALAKEVLNKVVVGNKRSLSSYQKKAFTRQNIHSVRFELSEKEYSQMNEFPENLLYLNYFSMAKFKSQIKRTLNTEKQRKWLADFFTSNKKK